MNSLYEAISILRLHLNENNKTIINSGIAQPAIILYEKKYVHNTNNTNNKHICKLYNLQKHSNYCKACNNNNLYLKNLHKIAYLKKNNNNKLCIELRKRFEKISKLEELYKLETTNCKIFKDSLKTNPSIYNETKKKLCNFFKKKRDLQKQIILEKNKLLNKDYSYVCLFKTIDV